MTVERRSDYLYARKEAQLVLADGCWENAIAWRMGCDDWVVAVWNGDGDPRQQNRPLFWYTVYNLGGAIHMATIRG